MATISDLNEYSAPPRFDFSPFRTQIGYQNGKWRAFEYESVLEKQEGRSEMDKGRVFIHKSTAFVDVYRMRCEGTKTDVIISKRSQVVA